MWATVTGRRATITGLHYSTPYRVWAGDATFDFTTAGPPDSPAASIGGGAILLDGQPYFPLIVLALCPVSYPNALAFRNHAVRRERLRRDRRAERRSRRQGLLADQGGGGRGERARRDRLVLPGCVAVTSSGERSPNQALDGSRYCGVPAHRELATAEEAAR